MSFLGSSSNLLGSFTSGSYRSWGEFERVHRSLIARRPEYAMGLRPFNGIGLECECVFSLSRPFSAGLRYRNSLGWGSTASLMASDISWRILQCRIAEFFVSMIE